MLTWGCVIFVALGAAALLGLDRSLARTQARIRAHVDDPSFMTDAERRMFLNAASLDQANHVMASVRQRRLEEFASWLELHASQTGGLWTMVATDGTSLTVDIYAPDDFQWYIPATNWRWPWQEGFPLRRLSWQWGLETPRVTAHSRGLRRRDQWVFEPTIDPEAQARTLR
jgi:hypothetical protein